MNTFEKARQFIYRNARPLDLARWQYHFEAGTKEAVLKALSFYQNEDGGFGHGLESDFLNPNSSPIATWNAAVILEEIQLNDRQHPIVLGILRYLESGADFDRTTQQWLNCVPTNNDYPHATWWTYNENSELRYNPTTNLAGFILKYAPSDSPLYQKGLEIAKQAVDWFFSQVPFGEQHITACFIQLYDFLQDADCNLVDMQLFKEKLLQQVHDNICHDCTKWATDYVCKPSNFFRSPKSMFYTDNIETADAEICFIENNQLEDGSYPVNWQWWTDYKEFEVSANRWKSVIIIENMLYLKGFGKI